jgi:hypothetical protein
VAEGVRFAFDRADANNEIATLAKGAEKSCWGKSKIAHRTLGSAPEGVKAQRKRRRAMGKKQRTNPETLTVFENR